MLDALRRGASSWVLKPLLILLVLAFIVWGIADVFTGTRQGALATVGSTGISVEEYQNTYSTLMNNFARRFGRRPTAEEARQRGLDRAVLEDLINSASLDEHARDLRLALPQQAVVTAIERDALFQGPDGTFNADAFRNFLRDAGFSERAFLAQKRKEEVRQQLTQSMFEGLAVPSVLADLVHRWREETRTIQHFTVDPAKVVKLAEPTEEQLKEVYGAQQRQFITPEFRHLGVLVLSAAEAKKRIEISEADIRRAFDGDKSAQVILEQRRVQQIAFKDKAAAEAAAKAIAAGRSFLDVAKETGATETDIDLGLVTKAQMLDAAIADAAFALEKDRVSPPVAGRFATVLLRVSDIVPGRTRSFDEMKDEIRGKLAEARLNEALRRLHDAVDDGRAAGKPLKEIAEATKTQFIDVPATDRLGRKPDGTAAYEGADALAILRAGFAGQMGSEAEAIDTADGGYAWVDVLGITPERQRPFEEVKDTAKAVWQSVESARQMTEATTRLIERAGKGETLTKLAGEVGAKLATSRPFKRFDREAGLPPGVIQRAYALPLGGYGGADAEDGKGRIVFRVVEVVKPQPATKEQVQAIVDQLRGELQQDAGQAYVTALRERYGVSVNEALFKRTAGDGGDTR